MRAIVAWRWISALLMVSLVTYQLLTPGTPWPQKVWAASLLVLFAVLLYFRIRAYRGIWRPASDSVPDLLRLTIRRKKVTIRLLWMNFGAILVVSIMSLLVCTIWLMLLRWQWNPASWHSLIVWITSISLVIPLFLVVNTVAMCTQRRRLLKAEALLSSESDETASG